jgi:hypothetical protein
VLRGHASLVIDPPGSDWPALLARRREHPFTESLRDQLGLPLGVPIVMVGHEPVFWHAGILAKYLAAHAAAPRLGASPAWLVVDHDQVGPIDVRCPIVEKGMVRVARIVLSRPDALDLPANQRPPIADPTPLERLADAHPDPTLADGLRRIADALREARSASNLAEHIADALESLIEPLIPRAPTIFASALSRTDAFAELVRRMFDDPERCVRAYNDACAAHPHAGVRPLELARDRIELPLWLIRPGAPRRRVFARQPHPPAEALAPRALFMTGLLRLAACDLFIHGRGGIAYDRVTTRWFADWLGEEALAPTPLVTATLLLSMTGIDPEDGGEARKARWRAHAARHNPALVGDPAADEKRSLLAAIARAPRRSAARLDAYRRMHALLAEYRRRRDADLIELDRRADRLSERARATAALLDRTYPFPLHGPAALAALRDAIAQEFATLAL